MSICGIFGFSSFFRHGLFPHDQFENVSGGIFLEEYPIFEKSENFSFHETDELFRSPVVEVKVFPFRNEVRSMVGFDPHVRSPDRSDNGGIPVSAFVDQDERGVFSGVSEHDRIVSEFVYGRDSRERRNVELFGSRSEREELPRKETVLLFGDFYYVSRERSALGHGFGR